MRGCVCQQAALRMHSSSNFRPEGDDEDDVRGKDETSKRMVQLKIVNFVDQMTKKIVQSLSGTHILYPERMSILNNKYRGVHQMRLLHYDLLYHRL